MPARASSSGPVPRMSSWTHRVRALRRSRSAADRPRAANTCTGRAPTDRRIAISRRRSDRVASSTSSCPRGPRARRRRTIRSASSATPTSEELLHGNGREDCGGASGIDVHRLLNAQHRGARLQPEQEGRDPGPRSAACAASATSWPGNCTPAPSRCESPRSPQGLRSVRSTGVPVRASTPDTRNGSAWSAKDTA